MNYPKSIKNLIECFRKFPGVGEKTAERFALSVINFDDSVLEMFSNSIKDVKYKIKRCTICNNLTEDDICDICRDDSRDSQIICVVEEAKNSILFEKMGSYKGKYHVLNGLISPLDGVGPDDINIGKLIERVRDENVKEVIIAVKPSIEGETTALYISRMLSSFDVRVTKIAHGIPMGTDMDYIDVLTLEMALEDRKIISSDVNN
jgi:recombination protein RecR